MTNETKTFIQITRDNMEILRGIHPGLPSAYLGMLFEDITNIHVEDITPTGSGDIAWSAKQAAFNTARDKLAAREMSSKTQTQEAKVPVRKRGRKPFPDYIKARALELHKDGFLLTEIARETGVSITSVNNWIKNA